MLGRGWYTQLHTFKAGSGFCVKVENEREIGARGATWEAAPVVQVAGSGSLD